jgi:trans-aconitate 2-methyltransferase
MSWNPDRYLAFGDHRTRPAADLLARVPLEAPRRVVDLGCGPGNSTELLVRRWPAADVVGLDASAEMLAKARASSVAARWIEADIASWTPDRALDLIYSNAALQWVGNHAALLPRLLDHLVEGGVLAVQMPRNFEMTSHQTLRQVAASGPWAARLESLVRATRIADAPWYYDLVAPRAAAVDIWETEYLQVLEGDDPVLRWVQATGLRPVIEALDEVERAAFEAEYGARLREAYPKRADGRTLYPFRRLFIVARR